MRFKLPVTRNNWLRWYLSPSYRRKVRTFLAEMVEDYDAAQQKLDAVDLDLWEGEIRQSTET